MVMVLANIRYSFSITAFSRAGKHLKMLLDSPVMSNISSGIGGTIARLVRTRVRFAHC